MTVVFPQTLVISLQPPARIFLGLNDDLNDPRGLGLQIGGVLVYGDFPPWPACPDILVDRERGVFAGVTFQVVEAQYEFVRRLASMLDSGVVHYNDISTPQAKDRYPGEAGEAHRLEIIWSPAEALELIPAQLSEGFWYYANEGLTWDGCMPIVAFQVMSIDEIASRYGLGLPPKFLFPALEINRI
jgi:hypothetical protein